MSRVRSTPVVVGILAGALALVGLTVPPWILPPIESIETGPAAIEMVQFKDGDRKLPYARLPEPLAPAEPYEGEAKASENYENVQVLGDLSDGEFTRTMLAITEWVAPEQGCEYCHNVDEGFASDSLYTKVVARQMLKMVRHVNSNWAEHVAPSGVTCYTCHRGQNVPPWTWYDQNEPGGDQFLGKPRPWHLEAKTIRQFFPSVPYEKYLLAEHANANIQSSDPLVSRPGKPEVALEQDAENLYLFMMQMTNQMGINCTFCHNSRAFRDWSQSTPYRWIAYWGIRMARDINSDYIVPLASVFPDRRKGPLGDPAKAHCGTCHLGNNKPLGGYNLLQHYLAALTEDGKAPSPDQKQAILLGTARPTAVTNPQDNTGGETPQPSPVNEKAIGQSVKPATGDGSNGQTSGGGTEYKSQTEPAQPTDQTLGGTVTPVPDSGGNTAPSPAPTGTDAPQGASPEQMRPEAPADSSGNKGTADAPSTGQPPSNPVPPDDKQSTPGETTPETKSDSPSPAATGGNEPGEQSTSSAGGDTGAPSDASAEPTSPPASSTEPSSNSGAGDGQTTAPATGAAPEVKPQSNQTPSKGPAQGTTSTFN